MIDIKNELITIIHKHLPGCKIMLFGSRARGTHTDGADFDIAIDTGSKIAWDTMLSTLVTATAESLAMLSISGAIEESNIPVHVDVVDVHNVSAIFIEAIKKDAIPWI